MAKFIDLDFPQKRCVAHQVLAAIVAIDKIEQKTDLSKEEIFNYISWKAFCRLSTMSEEGIEEMMEKLDKKAKEFKKVNIEEDDSV